MNFTPLNLVMFAAGIVLVYAAIKDVNPKDVVTNALQGKPTTKTPPPGATPPGVQKPPVEAVKPPPYPVTVV